MTRDSSGRTAVRLARPEGEIVIALVGNPNVGKSSLFNALTGLGVMTAHYPGTTREVHIGTARAGDRLVGVVDLPGVYGLSGATEEERIALQALEDVGADVVVVVVDPANLARTLRLAFEVMDRGLPTVVAVNLVDEAARAGIAVDTKTLADMLAVPVVATVGVRGRGASELVAAAFEAASAQNAPKVRYSDGFEELCAPLVSACARAGAGRQGRDAALALLAGSSVAARPADSSVADAAEAVTRAIASRFGETPAVRLARERHDRAAAVARAATTRVVTRRHTHRRDPWSLTTSPVTGVPIAVAVAGAIFGFLFFIGDRLAAGFSAAWEGLASPLVTAAVERLAGTGLLARVLLWGFDAGIEASLAIGIPYILTFYVLLGLLEDTGYLNSLAFLTDRVMHRLGLHGRAIVPLVAAAGCSVPALIAAQDLPTRRERFIASTLVLFVPCSARTAVILGAVGHYVGWRPTALVLAVVVATWLAIAAILQRVAPGTSGGLVMEMFPFRRPALVRVLQKAWAQFREFLFVATPIVIVGSLALGALYETGWLLRLSRPLEPVVVGWLGLPAVAGLTLLVGVLRKELSLQLLLAMAVATAGFAGAHLTDLMSPASIAVYALVNTVAFPCISSVAVFWKRHGLVRTLAVVGGSVVVALLVGGIAARVLPLLGMA